MIKILCFTLPLALVTGCGQAVVKANQPDGRPLPDSIEQQQTESAILADRYLNKLVVSGYEENTGYDVASSVYSIRYSYKDSAGGLSNKFASTFVVANFPVYNYCYLVTVNHAILDSEEVITSYVKPFDLPSSISHFPFTVVSRDFSRDMAIIRFTYNDGKDCLPVSFSSNPVLGEAVMAYGYTSLPYEKYLYYLDRVVSGIITGRFEQDENLPRILIDASIEQGFSGGAVASDRGVVGMTVEIVDGKSTSLGVIIPAEIITAFATDTVQQNIYKIAACDVALWNIDKEMLGAQEELKYKDIAPKISTVTETAGCVVELSETL